jgi:hypothetical protein
VPITHRDDSLSDLNETTVKGKRLKNYKEPAYGGSACVFRCNQADMVLPQGTCGGERVQTVVKDDKKLQNICVPGLSTGHDWIGMDGFTYRTYSVSDGPWSDDK